MKIQGVLYDGELSLDHKMQYVLLSGTVDIFPLREADLGRLHALIIQH